MNIREDAKNCLEKVVAYRRALHQIPEVGFDLDQTAAYVESRLDDFGIPHKRVVGCKCGIVADLVCPGAVKTVALRADMDALPVEEETGLPFASTNGNMHACAHDSHAAILLATAELLANHKDELHCNVRFLFQPAEELDTGAKKMIEGGVLEGVDEIIGLHAGSLSYEKPAGWLCFKPGSMMACMDRFIIDVVGHGAHGSVPHLSIDPIVTGAEIVEALQSIVSREISAQTPAVLSVCEFQGGSAFNIIPERVHIEGTIRAFSLETREFMKQRIGEIAAAVASAHKCQIEYEFQLLPPPVINDEAVTEAVRQAAETIFPGQVHTLETLIMGGEDFAEYLVRVPGTLFALINPRPVDGAFRGHHNPRFDIEEAYLDMGPRTFVEYLSRI